MCLFIYLFDYLLLSFLVYIVIYLNVCIYMRICVSSLISMFLY